MTHELKRVEPLRAANIGALVYGLLMAIFALIFLPIFVLAMLFAPSEGPGTATPLFMVVVFACYPILGAVMGWISGLLSAAIYNIVIRWSGGLLLEFS